MTIDKDGKKHLSGGQEGLDKATIERLKTCDMKSWDKALKALQENPLGTKALYMIIRRIKGEDVAGALFAIMNNFSVMVPAYALREFWKKNGKPVSDEEWAEARRNLCKEDRSVAYEQLTAALRNEYGFTDD